jgi:hypothetical protein
VRQIFMAKVLGAWEKAGVVRVGSERVKPGKPFLKAGGAFSNS